MRLLIDANILIDILQKRLPHYEYSAQIWNLCANRKVEGVVSSLTFANIVYVMRKRLGAETVCQIANILSQVFTFADFTIGDMQSSAQLQWPDYEDAVQAVTAKRIGADYIITRNGRDFTNRPVPSITPEDYCLHIFSDDISL